MEKVRDYAIILVIFSARTSMPFFQKPTPSDTVSLAETQGKKSGPRRQLFIFGVLIVLLFSGFVGYRIFQRMTAGDIPVEAAPVTFEDLTGSEASEEEDLLSVTPETPVLLVPSESAYESENFRVGEIAIGGELALIVPESDTRPLEIRSVRGEAFSEGENNSTKLVLTWETSKPAVSDIAYGRGIGQAEAVVREESYGTNHSVLIPGLATATTYVYVITVRDKWGNEVESDPYAVYTGSREISLFELIAGAVGDVFGWTVD